MTRRSLLCVGTAVVMGGCVPSLPPPDRPGITLDVPYITPRNDLCAATALAEIARYWERHGPFSPRLDTDDLSRLTRIPAKHGTLQDELTAQGRHSGFVVYPLSPSLDALISEVEAGHPVIILMNRGLAAIPIWHYAVVTGYDPAHAALLIHLGSTPHEAIPLTTADLMWQRSGRWGIVPLPPAHTAVGATPRSALKAIWELEASDPDGAVDAYTSALRRWNGDNDLSFALASATQRQGDPIRAEALYREILARDPDYLPAINNLAWILYRRGERDRAQKLLAPYGNDTTSRTQMIRRSYDEMK